jgi:hypothetical protein
MQELKNVRRNIDDFHASDMSSKGAGDMSSKEAGGNVTKRGCLPLCDMSSTGNL